MEETKGNDESALESRPDLNGDKSTNCHDPELK